MRNFKRNNTEEHHNENSSVKKRSKMKQTAKKGNNKTRKEPKALEKRHDMHGDERGPAMKR